MDRNEIREFTMKVLLVGPLYPPIHGQSLAFTKFVQSIGNGKKDVINTSFQGRSTIGKIFGTFKVLFSITIKTFFTRYDAVYFTCSRSFLGSIKDIVLIYLAKPKCKKLINHLHGSDFHDFLHSSPGWYRKVLLNSYKKVNTSIVLLESMKDQFKDFPGMKVEVVANFYDQELETGIVKKNQEKINLLYLSNIMSSKGILELLSAFDRLSQKYSNIILCIAGDFMSDGDMAAPRIKKKFYEKIKSKKSITYLGVVSGVDKVKLLQNSDIFILPSYYKSEAFPISIIEAMACENAIVTTNHNLIPQFVNEKNGMLVEPRSVDSLVNGVAILLDDIGRLRKIQKYNRVEAQKKYSLSRYIEMLHKIVLEG